MEDVQAHKRHEENDESGAQSVKDSSVDTEHVRENEELKNNEHISDEKENQEMGTETKEHESESSSCVSAVEKKNKPATCVLLHEEISDSGTDKITGDAQCSSEKPEDSLLPSSGNTGTDSTKEHCHKIDKSMLDISRNGAVSDSVMQSSVLGETLFVSHHNESEGTSLQTTDVVVTKDLDTLSPQTQCISNQANLNSDVPGTDETICSPLDASPTEVLISVSENSSVVQNSLETGSPSAEKVNNSETNASVDGKIVTNLVSSNVLREFENCAPCSTGTESVCCVSLAASTITGTLANSSSCCTTVDSSLSHRPAVVLSLPDLSVTSEEINLPTSNTAVMKTGTSLQDDKKEHHLVADNTDSLDTKQSGPCITTEVTIKVSNESDMNMFSRAEVSASEDIHITELNAESQLTAAETKQDNQLDSSKATYEINKSCQEMQTQVDHDKDSAVSSAEEADTCLNSLNKEITQSSSEQKSSDQVSNDRQEEKHLEPLQSDVLLSVDLTAARIDENVEMHSCDHKDLPSHGALESNSNTGNVLIRMVNDATEEAVDTTENVCIKKPNKEENDANDDVVGNSTQTAEPEKVMDSNNHLNSLTKNGDMSTQGTSRACADTSERSGMVMDVDTIVQSASADELSNESHSSHHLGITSNTQVTSAEAALTQIDKPHSPKDLSAVDTESNSSDNTYATDTEIPPGNPPSADSTQPPEASVPGSLADTESSNLSFASASTSTTQPLDMGDIIKAGMDTDAVPLPEVTSNVGDDSGTKMAVDEWCFQQAGAKKPETEEDSAGKNIKFNTDNIPLEYEEPEFDWEEYMEDTNSSAAPDTAFPHVEASLHSNFEKGMKFEVSHGTDNKYWIATVVMPCGQLLRLRYDGCESDSSKDFWCDAFKSDIHPLGWCRQNDKVLEPPDELKEKIPDWHSYVQTTLDQATTASDKLLGGVLGTAAVDQIKQNMLIEVQHENDLTRVWIARILENIGGRLLLRYEGTDSARQDFWLFYLHYRIHPMGWAQEMDMPYGPPEAVAEEWSRDEGWKAVLEKAQSDAQTLPFPADVLADQEMVLDHAFKHGWRLEALHPITKNQICPATVVQVYNDTYFLVQIDDLEPSLDDSPVQFCCHGGSRNIFPIKWAEKHDLKLKSPHGWQKDFDWDSYLNEMQAEAAPADVFSLECDEVKLAKGMKLEAANPEQPGQICVATVMQVCDSLILIHLESSADLNSYHMVDYQSQEIFPVGWCESNNYPLKPPNRAFFTHKQKKKPIEEPPSTSQKSASSSHSKSHHADKGGIWCPKIYFNHRCFSGPYLSKGRIAELPKSVGPGPVTLVMKEVLSMLINVAYKSSRVLRELQMDGEPDPSLHQQVLKAKYKGKSYRAVVELCKSSDQVVDFCKNICVKLECCPYLFSPTFINGQCPENCSQQSKTKYTAYVGKKKKKVGRPPGGHSNLEGGPKKPGKRRKRKRIGFFKVKKSVSNPDSTTTKEDDMDELDSVLQEESSNSTTASLDLTPSNGMHRRKRKYTRHVAPPLEMKTRGVKLPRYSIERRTRQPRLQLDTTVKPVTVDTAAAISELHIQQAGRKSAFVPVKKEDGLVLNTNPLFWSVGEVVDYIKTTDCAPLARLFKEEEIDGQALLLLTLPTVQELMEVKLGPAIKLCHLIEKLKIAFYEQYAT